MPERLFKKPHLRMSGEGSTVKFTVKDASVMINGANIVQTDIECSNGVIHVIDAVILPPGM